MLNLPGLQFDLGEDVAMLRESLQQFTATEITPRAAQIDRSDQFPMDLWRKFGDLGVLGITVAEDYGGTDMGYLAHIVAMEEISRASASVGLSYGAHSNLCVNQINRNGSARRRSKYLPKLVSRRAGRGAGDERAQRRLGRGVDEAARRLQGRSLGAQRQQDVDHQRARRRPDGHLRQERRRGRARAASRHSWSRRRSRASRSRRSSTSWACAAATPANWCSRTARCRPKTCSATWAAASTC